MVRFKNRYLLVEFLNPGSLKPSLEFSASSSRIHGDEDKDFEDDEEFSSPNLPFLVPSPDGPSRIKISDEGGSPIFRAIRSSAQEIFGDEGWGRIASSFKVIYHSPLTTLTILRVARPHYRLLWAALTMLREISSIAILPRVVAVSGTIKKLQNKAIAYHRLVSAQIVSASLSKDIIRGQEAIRAEKEEQLRVAYDNEEEAMNNIEG